jgi:DNA-repair protein XRCC2
MDFIDDHASLRPGNVLEVSGPLGSGKTEVLLHAAASCVLPRRHGGAEAPAIYIDLDGRLDIVRLIILLGTRMRKSIASMTVLDAETEGCLRRFRLVRCPSTAALLSALKTLRPTLQQMKDAGAPCRLLVIDGVTAFYWMDRDNK